MMHPKTVSETNRITKPAKKNAGEIAKKKADEESEYFSQTGLLYPYYMLRSGVCDFAIQTIKEMDSSTSELGTFFHLIDKSCGILSVYFYELIGTIPLVYENELETEKDKAEADIIKRKYGDKTKAFRASDMWLIDYMIIRKIEGSDRDGFFTALLIMVSLLVKKEFINWRNYT